MENIYSQRNEYPISEEDKLLIMKTLAKDVGLVLTENFTHYFLDTAPPSGYFESYKTKLDKRSLWLGGISNVRYVWTWNNETSSFEGSETDLICRKVHLSHTTKEQDEH